LIDKLNQQSKQSQLNGASGLAPNRGNRLASAKRHVTIISKSAMPPPCLDRTGTQPVVTAAEDRPVSSQVASKRNHKTRKQGRMLL
jgi:hypothetical protein